MRDELIKGELFMIPLSWGEGSNVWGKVIDRYNLYNEWLLEMYDQDGVKKGLLIVSKNDVKLDLIPQLYN